MSKVFIERTDLSNYIQGLEVRVDTSRVSDYREFPTITANFELNDDGTVVASIEIRLSGEPYITAQATGRAGTKYSICSENLRLCGTFPMRALEYHGVRLFPSILVITSAVVETKLTPVVNVKTPLTAQIVGRELVIGIDESPNRSLVSELTGIRAINGVRPDADGNINIISKTKEIIINVL